MPLESDSSYRPATGRTRSNSLSKTSFGAFVFGAAYVIIWIWSYIKAAQVAPSLLTVSVSLESRAPLTANTTSRQPDPTVIAGTFLIQVRGEMGNNLQKIAHGHALQWYAQDEFAFSPQLRMRHLKKPKWKTAREDIYQCFPRLRSFDYESGLSPTFTRIQNDHRTWLVRQNADWADQLPLVKEETQANITAGLRAMKQLSLIKEKPHIEYPIVVLGGPMRNAIIDKYYARFREELFVFDNGNDCCAQLPEPDEVVFHFRHFAKELDIDEQKSRGFEELDPRRVAKQLMGHLKPGQKVAITTRFVNEPVVEVYQRAMEKRGFQVRVVGNQTGVQDFCFLLRAKQELLGVAKSTYARWAAYLGDAERVQLYALDNVGSKAFIQQTMRFPWTNPELKRRIQFPVFKSLEKDA